MLLLPTAASLAAPVEWRAEAGRELTVGDARGPVNVGVRGDAWSVEVLTDTLDARWTPSHDRGRSWVGVRGEALFTQILNGRWVEGAPAPETAVLASYAGLDAGHLRYLPRHLYAGGQVSLRVVGFSEIPEGVDLPAGPVPLATPEIVAGWWVPAAEARLQLGGDLRTDRITPRATFFGRAEAGDAAGMEVQVHAGVAEDADDLTRARLGGLNPYVVPLAGAFWGEFWVEDYAAVRIGPRLAGERGRVALLADAAWFDGEAAVGFALDTRLEVGRAFAGLAVGVAPWLPREDGLLPGSLWLNLGVDWGSGAIFTRAGAEP